MIVITATRRYGMLVDNFNGTDLALIESSAIEPTRTAERSLLHFKGNRYFTHPIIDEDLSAMEVLSPGFSIPRVKYNPFDIKSLMNYNTNDHNSAVKEHVKRNKREDER